MRYVVISCLAVVGVISCDFAPLAKLNLAGSDAGGSDSAAGSSDSGSGGSDGAAGGPPCGARGEVCCSGSCDLRASCDGTACIAADVWTSEVDGTANFNGGAWTHPLLSGHPLPPVNGLWGTTAIFVVGVGSGGAIVRRDDTGWHRDVVGATDGTGTLNAVAGSGPGDVWAVGQDHFSHFDGIAWTQSAPPLTRTEDIFTGVWLSGPGEGWACGNRADLAQLSHGTWATVQDGINGPSYRGVWGSGPRDVWIVGSRQNGQHVDALLIRHFDGNTWQDGAGMLDPQGIIPPLNAVWGSDAVHVWAVGEEGTVLFWDGVAWTPLLTGATNALFSVWGSGPSDVWIGGIDGVRHFNGVSWAPVGTITGVNALWLSPE